MDNLHITGHNVKSGVGPFLGRMSCVEAACQDKDCKALKAFTVIKSRARGTYDYVPGNAQLLMSDDMPIADYWIGLTGQWRYKLRQQEKTK
jgi:hypothetical protein